MTIRQINRKINVKQSCLFGLLVPDGRIQVKDRNYHGYHPQDKQNTSWYYQTFILRLIT